MRRLLSSGAFLVLITGSAMYARGIWVQEPTDDLTVGVKLENQDAFQIFKVPVVSDPKQRKKFDDRWAGGEWAFTGSCLGKICRYGVYITADRQGNGAASVWTTLTFELQDGRKCKVTKVTQVGRGEFIKRKVKCGGASVELRLGCLRRNCGGKRY